MRMRNWVDIKAELRNALLWLPHFIKNPVQGMRELPDWDWHTLLILPPAFALACGVVKNLIDRDFIGLFTDLLISPLAAIIVTGIGAGLFFYTFKFLFAREFPYRSIYTHMVFAGIPCQITNITTKFFPPVNLLGLTVSFALLYVGFAFNFNLDAAKLKRLFAALYSVVALWWVTQLFKVHYRADELRVKATPESLDILERELNDKKGQ